MTFSMDPDFLCSECCEFLCAAAQEKRELLRAGQIKAYPGCDKTLCLAYEYSLSVNRNKNCDHPNIILCSTDDSDECPDCGDIFWHDGQ